MHAVELLPSCKTQQELRHGQIYPSGKRNFETCGKIDSRIERFSEDFSRRVDLYTILISWKGIQPTFCIVNRLLQFAGDQALFENEERSEQWCGVPSVSCVDCRWSIAGSSTQLKCADRMMSERLEDRVWRLARLVKREWPKRKSYTLTYVRTYTHMSCTKEN